MVEKQTDRQINYQFKLLYAFGVIFVAAGHCGYGGVSLGYDWFVPHAFHLGLFMFISGYFFHEDSLDHPLAFVGRKAKSLLLPLYLWNLFYGCLVLALKPFGFTIGEELSLRHLILSPWTDGHQFIYNMGGWFVPSLFLCHVVTVFLRAVFRKLHLDNAFLVAGLYLLIGMLGLRLSLMGYQTGPILIFTRLAYFLPFYGIGMLYRKHLEGTLRKIPSAAYFAILLGIQLMLITWKKGQFVYYPAWGSGFENALIPFAEGMCGILFWVKIAEVLTPVLGQNRMVLAFSKYGYGIMIHQIFGFMAVKTLFAGASRFLPVFQDFSFLEYRTNVWYYYLPRGLSQWYLVYLIGGLAVAIGMGMFTKWLSNRLFGADRRSLWYRS